MISIFFISREKELEVAEQNKIINFELFLLNLLLLILNLFLFNLMLRKEKEKNWLWCHTKLLYIRQISSSIIIILQKKLKRKNYFKI